MNQYPSVDSAVLLLVVGAFVKILPPLAALFAILWYSVQLWQSETGKIWRSRWLRLFLRKPLSFEDKVSFAILVFGGSGAIFAAYYIGSVMP